MKNLIVDVPGMYGDHHVLRLRQVLLDLQGVSDVSASAAQRKVAVRFDEATIGPDAIRDAIICAGYPPEEQPGVSEFPKRHEDGSGWYLILDRTTTTEHKDREMAGDFRRY